MVLVIFGILEALYGSTNAEWTFLKHILGRSIFDLAIPLDSLVPLPPTIWLTAVKHESLSFFQRNKDPRAYIGKFWDLVRIRKIVWILMNRSYFFRFSLQGSAICLNMPKNGVLFFGHSKVTRNFRCLQICTTSDTLLRSLSREMRVLFYNEFNNRLKESIISKWVK